MSDVSAPATPRDDEIVTRKILREELSKELANYPTKEDLRNEFARSEAEIARRFKAMEEWLLDLVNRVLEPFLDHGPRITRLEARTTVLADRADTLEQRRARPRRRRQTPRRKARSR